MFGVVYAVFPDSLLANTTNLVQSEEFLIHQKEKRSKKNILYFCFVKTFSCFLLNSSSLVQFQINNPAEIGLLDLIENPSGTAAILWLFAKLFPQ